MLQPGCYNQSSDVRRTLLEQPSDLTPHTHTLPPGLKYGSANVLADAGIREGVKKFTDWPTIPQVGAGGALV